MSIGTKLYTTASAIKRLKLYLCLSTLTRKKLLLQGVLVLFNPVQLNITKSGMHNTIKLEVGGCLGLLLCKPLVKIVNNEGNQTTSKIQVLARLQVNDSSNTLDSS